MYWDKYYNRNGTKEVGHEIEQVGLNKNERLIDWLSEWVTETESDFATNRKKGYFKIRVVVGDGE